MRLLTTDDPPATHPPADLHLVGEHVRLVPLRAADATAIQPWVDGGEEGFELNLGSPLDFDGSAQRFVDWLVGQAGSGITPFAVTATSTGEVLGYTRYLHIEPRHRALHVGGTWYAPPVRGTVVNPESKLLLLAHAFEVAGFNRVQIQTDVRNLRSQRAIARIGGVHEGVSRADYQRRDGTVRDTWVASILRSEWPQVRERLRDLIAHAPSID